MNVMVFVVDVCTQVDPGRGYDIYNHIHYDAPDKYIARFEDISGPRPGHDRFDEVDHFRQVQPYTKRVHGCEQATLIISLLQSSANGSRPGMEYRLNYETKQCFERPLEEDFRPIEIPSGAKLLAEYVIGLEGTDAKPQLKVLTYGLTAPGGRRIIASATKTGCIPVHLTEFSGGQRPGFISSSLV